MDTNGRIVRCDFAEKNETRKWTRYCAGPQAPTSQCGDVLDVACSVQERPMVIRNGHHVKDIRRCLEEPGLSRFSEGAEDCRGSKPSVTHAATAFDHNNVPKAWKSRTARTKDGMEQARIIYNRTSDHVRRFPRRHDRAPTVSSDDPASQSKGTRNTPSNRARLSGAKTLLRSVPWTSQNDVDNHEAAKGSWQINCARLALDHSKLPLEVNGVPSVA